MEGNGDTWGRHHADWTTATTGREAKPFVPRRKSDQMRALTKGLFKIAEETAAKVDLSNLAGPTVGGVTLTKRMMVAPSREQRAGGTVGVDALERVVHSLQDEVRKLREELDAMKRAAEPQHALELSSEEVYVLVSQYYDANRGKELYPSDVAAELNLDAFAVFEATNRLVAEGRLE